MQPFSNSCTYGYTVIQMVFYRALRQLRSHFGDDNLHADKINVFYTEINTKLKKKKKKNSRVFSYGRYSLAYYFRSSVFGEFATRPGTTTTSGTLMMSAPHAPSTGTRQGHITSPYPNHHLRLPPLLPLQGGQTVLRAGQTRAKNGGERGSAV